MIKEITKNLIKKWNEDLILMFIFYVLAHGLILVLGNAIYWDDWAYFGADSKDILNDFSQAGSFLNYGAWIHIGLLNEIGPWSYKIATFFCFYFSGVFFYWVLQRDMHFEKQIALMISVLYLIIPLNIARVASINFIYTLSVFFFMYAWWRMGASKWVSLLCFGLAFNTQSLLVFYALPIFFLFSQEKYSHNFNNFIKDNFEYLILPFVWYLLKLIYFKPYGEYAGYNEGYALSHVATSIGMQISDFTKFVGNDLISIANSGATFLIAVPIFWFLYINKKFDHKLRATQFLYMLSLGLIMLILGCFPYWILGITPTFWEWTSRHQLLMPFGFSLILAAILSIVVGLTRKALLSSFFALFIAMNILNYYDFYKDWIKQRQLIQLMSKSELIKNSTLILFDDKTPNAIRRGFRYYEWNGLLNQAYPHDGNRLGLTISQVVDYESGVLDKHLNSYYTSRSYVKLSAKNALVIKFLEKDGEVVMEAGVIGIHAN
jgi:hypothetical protein